MKRCRTLKALFLLVVGFVYCQPRAAVAAEQGLTLLTAGSHTSLALNGTIFHTTTAVVEGARLIAPPDSHAKLVLWRECDADHSARPCYAISLDGADMQCVRQTSYDLLLDYACFDPVMGTPAVAAELRAGPATTLHIVQFVTPPLPLFRAQIEARGGQIRNYLPRHAFIVQMTPEVRTAVAALPYVRWIGAYHPAYRLEPALRASLLRLSPEHPRGRYYVRVFTPEQRTAVALRLAELGGEVHAAAGPGLLDATLSAELLREIVHWDEVLYVDRWGPVETDMNIVRELSGANYIETQAGYTGAGVTGAVIDVGFDSNHPDFQHHPPIVLTSPGTNPHGTACYGIIFGDGTGNPAARGLLPDGQGIFANWSFIPSRYQHILDLIQLGAVFESSSVGSPRTTHYTNISAEMDQIIFDLDFFICQSMSNSGDQQARPEAWAKNIMPCGGINHFDTLTPADDCWCGAATIGPAEDGRIKPDLSHFYDHVLTTAPNGQYTDFGGTSASTPIVCGYTGLFFQMWAAGIFGNPVDPGGTVFSNRPHVSTARAMMINTAWQYPFSGPTHDLTRVHQGWGLPDVRWMYDMRGKMLIIDETELLASLATYSTTVHVAPAEPELRATLVYSDPPGVPGAAVHRVNDLTLRVFAPDGAVYWGNYGLLAGNYSLPGGSANTRDTVENVFVADPAPGAWLVEVIASEINADGHVETPAVDADFALVISGVMGGRPGDCNCDGALSWRDIDYFVAAFNDNVAAWEALFAPGAPTCPFTNCDVNRDGNVNWRDVDPFVAVLGT